jgi:hypothetical protein
LQEAAAGTDAIGHILRAARQAASIVAAQALAGFGAAFGGHNETQIATEEGHLAAFAPALIRGTAEAARGGVDGEAAILAKAQAVALTLAQQDRIVAIAGITTRTRRCGNVVFLVRGKNRIDHRLCMSCFKMDKFWQTSNARKQRIIILRHQYHHRTTPSSSNNKHGPCNGKYRLWNQPPCLGRPSAVFSPFV